jgi:hypothetical protein
MGDHIVRRGPPTRPPQPRERRPTAEIPEQQLLELIRKPTTEELEAELELVDGVPKGFPDATPDSLPRVGSPRFAHTLRRGMQPVVLPSRRPPPPPPRATPRPDKRPASSAAAMPRPPMRAGDGGRPIGRVAIGTPPLPAPALKPAQSTPRLARSSNPMVPTRPARAVEPVADPAVVPPGPASPTVAAAPPPPVAPMPVEPKVIVATIDAPISAETPELPSAPSVSTAPRLPTAPTARRARLVLPVGLVLLVLGTLAVILI